MQIFTKTVSAYLKELPPERRVVIEAVRAVVLKNLPKGYEETTQYGMISYVVPLKTFPKGYLGKKDVPLPYMALAAQKNFYALYFMNLYSDKAGEDWFKKAYEAAGKKLDMGKSCVRFKKLEDLPLAVIVKAVKLTSVKKFVEQYESGRE